jgi:tungstate transport system permease protein
LTPEAGPLTLAPVTLTAMCRNKRALSEFRSCRAIRYCLVNEFRRGFLDALVLIGDADPALFGIVGLSLAVSITAVTFAAVIGMPLGATLAIGRFPGRQVLIVLFNAFMGLPPVVVGLAVYLLLSRAGPLGRYGLLFTPTAMIIAQSILVVPIVAALTRQTIETAWGEYREQLRSLGAKWWHSSATLLWDTRLSLMTVVLAGFGRAVAEVGAVMIVGGNIDGVTRVMTTAIALETSKGDLPLALALGVILLALVIAVNAVGYGLNQLALYRYG